MIILWILAKDQQQICLDDFAKQASTLDPKMLALVKKMQSENGHCSSCQTSETQNEEDFSLVKKSVRKDDVKPRLYIFMSYSVPKQVWQDLKKESQNHAFEFVIKGLPGNSFQTLIQNVKEYDCPVIIHPDLFDQFNITQVPAFVLTSGTSHKCVYGNVSLATALLNLRS